MYKASLLASRRDSDGPRIYRVEYRVNTTCPTGRMIVKIVGKARNPRLAAILDDYRKPVVVTNGLGAFQLDRARQRSCSLRAEA